MNKLDYTCSIADPEREHNMLFEFWDDEKSTGILSTIIALCADHKYQYFSGIECFKYCRPSTRIQEFISVDVIPSGFVWEVVWYDLRLSDNAKVYHLKDEQHKAEIKDVIEFTCMRPAQVKCIGLASNYAHLADELNMKVIEGVRCEV